MPGEFGLNVGLCNLNFSRELSYEEGFAYAVVIKMGTKLHRDGFKEHIPNKYEQKRTFKKANVAYYPGFDMHNRQMKGIILVLK